MSPELRRELLTLSPEERQELADELYQSLMLDDSMDQQWQRAWSKELEQRMDDVAAKRVELIDADDVHRESRAEISNRRR